MAQYPLNVSVQFWSEDIKGDECAILNTVLCLLSITRVVNAALLEVFGRIPVSLSHLIITPNIGWS